MTATYLYTKSTIIWSTEALTRPKKTGLLASLGHKAVSALAAHPHLVDSADVVDT